MKPFWCKICEGKSASFFEFKIECCSIIASKYILGAITNWEKFLKALEEGLTPSTIIKRERDSLTVYKYFSGKKDPCKIIEQKENDDTITIRNFYEGKKTPWRKVVCKKDDLITFTEYDERGAIKIEKTYCKRKNSPDCKRKNSSGKLFQEQEDIKQKGNKKNVSKNSWQKIPSLDLNIVEVLKNIDELRRDNYDYEKGAREFYNYLSSFKRNGVPVPCFDHPR